MYELVFDLENLDRESIFSQWTEEIGSGGLLEDGTVNVGAVFRRLQQEYGRCDGPVFVNGPDGSPVKVGWHFVSRQAYEDSGRYGRPAETYLRGAWVTVRKLVEPAQPAVWERVAVG